MQTARSSAGLLTLYYNGVGERILKKYSSQGKVQQQIFIYDPTGPNLLGEYDATGNNALETIYLGATPVALLRSTAAKGKPSISYILADQITAPRAIVDSSTGKVIWRWDLADPFGVDTPINIAGGQDHLLYNLRFPGQYFDKETSRNYNYFRDYDPQVGRYVQSDPMGLRGGYNTYVYSTGNPLTYSDPWGLETVVIINNNTPVIGSHAGVYVDNSGDPVLYDPGGSYPNRNRGSGDALYGEDAGLDGYIAHQRADGARVDVYRFNTSPQEEREIARRIEEQGGAMGGLCAVFTSRAISGIGPFKDLGIAYTPAGLGRFLAGIPRGRK
jgi:RHS repeat-associated protein